MTSGRDVVEQINELLSLPFAIKIATKDFHPQDHISFASNHPPPNNSPFESTITVVNPLNPNETQRTRLWPDHCVQGTFGSQLISELDIGAFDHIIEKGQDKRVEMYSAFKDPFNNPCVSQSDLAATLQAAGITHVYLAGLAMDYCVKFSAVDAVNEGFTTYVVREATRPVDPAYDGHDLKELGVGLISIAGNELAMVKNLG